jgi:hypothetical protein
MLNPTVNVIEQLAATIRRREDFIVRHWVEEIYTDGRTELPEVLSFEQLVEPVQEMLGFLCELLERFVDEQDIAHDVRQLRAHAQIRFHQGVLIDEVARELMKWALGHLNTFIDEMVIQSLVIYAANMRPPVETRTSPWPPPRIRKIDFPNLR